MPPEDFTRFLRRKPVIPESVYVGAGVQIIGDVEIGEDANLWPNVVVRGDLAPIRIGKRTNIQDLSLLHVTYPNGNTQIGEDCTIGHSAIIHACTIGNFVLVGMGSIILDGAEIEDFVLLGAGSLVTSGTKIPKGSKAFGRPAKVVGKLTDEELIFLKLSSDRYVQLAKAYQSLKIS